MIHSFDTRVASVVGIKEAILLYNIEFWIDKNKANKKHFHKGRYWTYNSSKAFTELFPYLTQKMIENALSKLIKSGYLIKDCFNENVFDRTSWYSLSDKYYQLKDDKVLPKNKNDIFENKEISFSNLGKSYNVTDRKADIKQQIINNKATENEKADLTDKANKQTQSLFLQNLFNFSLFKEEDLVTQADLDYLNRFSHLISSDLGYLRELALFILNRRDMKKPLTTRALKQTTEKLNTFENPKEALLESIRCGWLGVFEKVKAGSLSDFKNKTHNAYEDDIDKMEYVKMAYEKNDIPF